MEQLQQIFAEKFGEKGTGSYFAPGRINLIGEHTDYNGGYVFPASITIGTYGVARKRADKQIRLYSENFPEKGIITFSLDDLEYRKEDDWTNYPKGVIRYLKAAGHAIDSGIEIAFYGNIPNGAGLSSSASIELLTGVILDDLFGCEEALKRLQTKLKIQSLGELDEATFFAHTSLIEDPTLIKRAKHAVTENQRTLKAKAALEAGDLESFGHLLDASHASLRDDYEVTGIELDTLVAAAQEQPAVLGARMTGAGFGGCAIALVKKSEWEAFATAVKESYREKIGYETDIYQASIDDGARKL